MPRTYSFDHFQSMNPDSQKQRGLRQKSAPAAGARASDHQPHYGKKFAQTEELAQAHVMTRQLEELAGITASPAPFQDRLIELSPEGATKMMRSTSPIGALPVMEEAPPRGRVTELIDDATRHGRLIRLAARDVGMAGLKVALLPLNIARLAVRRLTSRWA